MSYRKPKSLEYIIPGMIFFILMIVFHESGLDEKIASFFYTETGSWIYRDNFFLEKILHKGGVIFSTTLLVGFIGYFIFLSIKKADPKRRGFIGHVIVSSLITIITIFFFKRWSTLPCPWNSVAFGGGTMKPAIWQMFSLSLPGGHCFPGGHSSAGYSFLSIFFGYKFIYGRTRLIMLVPGVVMGIAFGLTQQARGAHFMSHDMATVMVSIFASWATSLLFFKLARQNEN